MKLTGLLLLLFLAHTVFAEGGGKEDRFDEHKKEAIEELEAHIKDLQKDKDCKSAAKNWDDMKNCHKEMEKAREQRRLGDIDKRIKRLQEEKEKVGKKKD